jgi:hypothetical protein
MSTPATAARFSGRSPNWARTVEAIEARGVASAQAGLPGGVGDGKRVPGVMVAELPADGGQDEARRRFRTAWRKATRARNMPVTVARLDTAAEARGTAQAAALVLAEAPEADVGGEARMHRRGGADRGEQRARLRPRGWRGGGRLMATTAVPGAERHPGHHGGELRLTEPAVARQQREVGPPAQRGLR